jgi:hypothetical protein
MQGSRPKHTIEDFAAKLFSHAAFNGECLEWQSGLRSGGYGHFTYCYKSYVAHRVCWQLIYGDIPDGLFVCHKCDNRKCIRPDHLFLGTQQDNIQDASRKKRLRFGAANHNSKFTPDDVLEIRYRHSIWGDSIRGMAREYNVDHKAIWNIVHNRSWEP